MSNTIFKTTQNYVQLPSFAAFELLLLLKQLYSFFLSISRLTNNEKKSCPSLKTEQLLQLSKTKKSDCLIAIQNS